ncbi:protein arginine N-methyltransferase 5-like [Contarinia nasturtii]|uniref:protein arginine N-methyltransferase 5-like n=1 Tax=Contarinia nasturtii TaxID=265458 RepID=UPI0012D3E9FD|nr:protein arginine N-methyltransferase 5-like [Contarinia nasturtii]
MLIIELKFVRSYDDLLEIPLQPLYDNLREQRAIELAFMDKISDEEADIKTAIVMVVGAGRGPLVRSAFNASANVNRKIKMYVIEKNPNAIVTLTALQEELWKNKDMTIISTDMRYFEPSEKVDILVSELLGSFGDNELSPECLDGAQKHLKEDGISIPCQSTSYINPVMAPKLCSIIREVRGHMRRGKPNTYEKQAESPYVVYLKNVYHITKPQPVFTFVHPNNDEVIDNSRFIKMEFDVAHDCVLTGFAGYFETILYKDIKLSIHPEEHTRGLISWFSLYFPLTEPQQLRAGDRIKLNFWRCISNRKVWYEWSTTSPTVTHVHNLKGWAFPIYK